MCLRVLNTLNMQYSLYNPPYDFMLYPMLYIYVPDWRYAHKTASAGEDKNKD